MRARHSSAPDRARLPLLAGQLLQVAAGKVPTGAKGSGLGCARLGLPPMAARGRLAAAAPCLLYPTNRKPAEECRCNCPTCRATSSMAAGASSLVLASGLVQRNAAMLAPACGARREAQDAAQLGEGRG